MFERLLVDSQMALPILGWAILAILVLMIKICTRGVWLPLFATVIGLIGLIFYSATHLNSGAQDLFHGALKMDSSFYLFNLIGLGIHLAVVLMLIPGLERTSKIFKVSYEQFPELLICLLFSGFGLSVLIAASDLSTLFLGLETLSIGVYCLCGFYRTEIRSTESAFKYLMIGAFSTVLFLYGLAFVYGATGATNYSQIQSIIEQSHLAHQPLLMIAVAFLIAAFAFKLAFVPFHLYVPDVYEGAPTPITAYLATVIKVGVIAAAFKVFWGFFGSLADYWEPFWMTLCVLSILLGNILALQQKTLKKLLAYSSISHSGFLGLAMVLTHPGVGTTYPLMAYLVVYSAVTLGLFSSISFLENREQVFLVEDLKGLGQKRFWTALFIGIFILALAGLPPFAGFMIKFWILEALIEQHHIGVAIAAICGSVIGAAYYLRILMLMFMSEEQGSASEWVVLKDRLYVLRLIVFLAAILSLVGGMRPQLYADWILSALALK
ncbi:MAG: NADH-quinone oxidoreductase subunit [Bacteriovoracaceae bacterium]|nr:NADH-quinone oxidoreductase subunit [Bacteriovoracaceae bacterium]